MPSPSASSPAAPVTPAPGGRGRVAISLGDPWGIGPETVARALARLRPDPARLVIVGPAGAWAAACAAAGYPDAPRLEALPDPVSLVPGQPPADGGRLVLDTLARAVDLVKTGLADALCTAPLNKALLHAVDPAFVGHTEYLGAAFGVAEPTMSFVGPRLVAALVTTHVSLRALPDLVTAERVGLHLARLAELLVRRGTPGPIAVCGLNPHAGEDGAFGREDLDRIAPAVAAARARGLDCAGPLPADSVFKQALAGHWAGVLAMYHDQALTVFKATDGGRGVNVTLGLPVVRTSPDHGTAYDIAGRGLADPSSTVAALELALGVA